MENQNYFSPMSDEITLDQEDFLCASVVGVSPGEDIVFEDYGNF